MRQFLRILSLSGLTLTALLVLGVAVQAPAAPPPDRWVGQPSRLTQAGVTGQGYWVQRLLVKRAVPPGAFLLAQQPETLKQKPAAPAPSSNEPRKFRKKAAPPPAPMERQDSKSPVFGDDPERAGTKKLGGQIIRGQEGPGGE